MTKSALAPRQCAFKHTNIEFEVPWPGTRFNTSRPSRKSALSIRDSVTSIERKPCELETDLSRDVSVILLQLYQT